MPVDPPSPRRPALAAALGLIQAGLGHVYAGRFLRGMVIVAILLIAAAGWTVLIANDITGRWMGIGAATVVILLLYVGQAVDAMRVAREAPVPYALKSYNTAFTYAFVLVFGLALGRVNDWVRGRYVEPFRVPSAAMSETIQPGDWLYVNKRDGARRAAVRNALVVYRSPDDGALAIKRVVGIDGDTLRMVSDTLFRNDRPVDEPFAHIVPSRPSAVVDTAAEHMRNWGPVVVRRGTLFVLGDNRHASKDSRHVGLIPIENVVGIPSVVYFSYDPEGDLPFPGLTAIRWSRIGLSVRQ